MNASDGYLVKSNTEVTRTRRDCPEKELVATATTVELAYLEREEERAIQRSDLSQGTVVFLGGKRHGDVVPAPVHAGMRVAGCIHGEAIGHIWSGVPVAKYDEHMYAG